MKLQKSLSGVLSALVLGLAGPAAAEQEETALLGRVLDAARSASFTGEVLYHRSRTGGIVRITRVVEGNTVRERIEALEGPRRLFVRDHDRLLWPPGLADGRIPDFLSTMPDRLSDVLANYRVLADGNDRVAGRDVRRLVLEPRDQLRYRHRLWVDRETGLLLKVSIQMPDGQEVEQFTFTDVQFDKPDHEGILALPMEAEVMDEHPGRARMRALMSVPDLTRQVPVLWDWSQMPRGFHKKREIYRSLPGRDGGVHQILFSDGLTGVSAFVEAAPGEVARPEPQLRRMGTTHMLTVVRDGHRLTLVGETPAETLHQMAAAVRLRQD